MNPAETTPPSAPEAPPETRTCRKCNETKVLKPETWPYKISEKRIYRAHGFVCLACEKIRKAEYEIRSKQLAADVKPKPDPSNKGKPDDERKAITAASKLDAALALKSGARALNEAAPGVVTRILMWAEDETHANHLWAVEFLAQRIMPRKLFEELGGAAAGIGTLQDKRPQFVIQVLPAQPGGVPEGRVFQNGESETVELLPAPAVSVATPE